MRLRYIAKLLVGSILHYSGLLDLYLRLTHRHHGVVLLYHRVLSAPEAAQSYSSKGIIVTPETFERHLRFLRRRFTLVNPAEFQAWWRGDRRFSRPPCLISFDDGWKDNLENALPILRDQQVPALIFLPSGYIGGDRVFWQEQLSHLLDVLGANASLKTHPTVIQHRLDAVFIEDRSARAEQARETARQFKDRTPDQIQTIVENVTAMLRSTSSSVRRVPIDDYLSWADVQTMLASDIHFGSHTVSHRMLTRLTASAVRDELSRSKQQLEQTLARPVRLLAYPNGDHDSQTAELARQAGYELAFTTIPGWVKPGDDSLRLPRLNVHEQAHRHIPVFYASILGLF